MDGSCMHGKDVAMDVFGVHTHNQVIVSEGVAWCAALSPDWVPGYYLLGTTGYYWVPTGYQLGTWVGTWLPGYHLGTTGYYWVPAGSQ